MATVFCISGASALVYQVTWQRILALHSGVGIYSVAMIVSTFMAGLGIGSFLGGVWSVRLRPATAALAFAAVELCIGAWAAVSCTFYYDVLTRHADWLYSGPWRTAAVHFLTLLPPTCLMGMSLPLLVHAVIEDPRTESGVIGWLYGINVFGAATGALLTPWVLVPTWGIEGAVWIGAFGNVLAGTLVLIFARRTRAAADGAGHAPTPIPTAVDPTTDEPARHRAFGLWFSLYFLSGFCALALEIVWFRLIDVAAKSTAFTFGTVIAMYLLGLGIGCMIAVPRVARLRRPLMAFLLCQSVLMAYTGLAVLTLVRLPPGTPVIERLIGYWRSLDIFELGRAWSPFELVTLYLILPILLYGLPTVLMGFSFGVLQRAVQDDRRTAGRKVGILQMANIAGNVAGSLIAALVLLNWFGTAVTLTCLLALALVFPIVGWWAYPKAWQFPVAVVTIAGLIALFPTNDELWRRLHGRVNGQALIAEDATGLVALTAEDRGQWRVSVDGKSHSWLPFGSIHSTLGAVAAAVHPAPLDVAIIGLGSGDTAWAAASRPETERLLVYELLAPEKRLLDALSSTVDMPKLRSFLSDPRLQLVTADGRNALAKSDRMFDIIEADAQRPTTAYAGNLYSVEFFRLCASRLKPGGIMTQWAPTPRIHRTFRDVFAHVIGFPDGIVVGSNQPIAVEPDVWLARLRTPAVQAYLGPAIAEQVASTLSRSHPARTLDLSWIEPNEDLFPRDEFLTPIRR